MSKKNVLAIIIALLTLATSVAILLTILKKKRQADEFYEDLDYIKEFDFDESSEPTEDIINPPITED